MWRSLALSILNDKAHVAALAQVSVRALNWSGSDKLFLFSIFQDLFYWIYVCVK